MSQIISTHFGRFFAVTDGLANWLLFECPRCGEKHQLSEAQMQGLMPVVCLGYPEALTPHYFEAHPFGSEVMTQFTLARFFGGSPFSNATE